MVPFATWLVFLLACIALVATPGPNVLYLVSRTLAQGRAAGFVSLAGTATGFLFHVLAAALGLSALLAAVPLAYDTIRIAGAVYLAWLAWATWRSPDIVPGAGDVGKASALLDASRKAEALPTASSRAQASPTAPSKAGALPAKLYRDGVITAILNPKVAMFQLALFPQFVDPAHGSVLAQSLVLGATQVGVHLAGDSMFVLAASGVRRWFGERPTWTVWSKRVLASVFAALAARLALDDHR
jgi:threonine/homoserine/homoserine lactone efflux protein